MSQSEIQKFVDSIWWHLGFLVWRCCTYNRFFRSMYLFIFIIAYKRPVFIRVQQDLSAKDHFRNIFGFMSRLSVVTVTTTQLGNHSAKAAMDSL